ncbi:hypothetical protein [Stenotrophomonas indicatrix]|uniref:hypothetical protein n=1 Tax=Stenotrophomonas indicatrix TaxID=2045451 RepID=UPI0007397CF5|nr:hypothetical protein [Stenotrophomonas indicatrix]OUL11606.1 hypothetical protein B0X78_12895 [bacterium AM6]CRD54345.1 conserved hypothetical protein [Stenotrophomonas indicatrix]
MTELRLSSFADGGNLDKERLALNAKADLKVGDYAILLSKVSSTGKATSGAKQAFWFPDQDVKEGDVVILYTKKGVTATKDLSDGRIAHFFYWGMSEAIWTSDKVAAVVLKVEDWHFRRPALAPSAD